MTNTQNDGSCRTNSWLVAIVLGILGFLLSWRWLDWSFVMSVIVGIVIFFVIGYLLVSMLCGKSNAASTAAPAPVPTPVAKAAPAAPAPAPAAAPAAKEVVKEPEPAPAEADDGAAQKPAMLTAAREGQADDLKKIKGVGPGLEKLLNEMGVFHFDQMAGWSAGEVAWVDDNMLRFKGRATRDGWVEQAKTLAEGGDTAFSKKVDKGGVY